MITAAQCQELVQMHQNGSAFELSQFLVKLYPVSKDLQTSDDEGKVKFQRSKHVQRMLQRKITNIVQLFVCNSVADIVAKYAVGMYDTCQFVTRQEQLISKRCRENFFLLIDPDKKNLRTLVLFPTSGKKKYQFARKKTRNILRQLEENHSAHQLFSMFSCPKQSCPKQWVFLMREFLIQYQIHGLSFFLEQLRRTKCWYVHVSLILEGINIGLEALNMVESRCDHNPEHCMSKYFRSDKKRKTLS